METIKKYWKEFLIGILIIVIILFQFKNSSKELSVEELKEIETKNTIANLLNAQSEYNKLLTEKREKLEKEEEELRILEGVLDVKVEEGKKQITTLKTKRDVLNAKYKVGSAYDTTKLDKLLKLYASKKAN